MQDLINTPTTTPTLMSAPERKYDDILFLLKPAGKSPYTNKQMYQLVDRQLRPVKGVEEDRFNVDGSPFTDATIGNMSDINNLTNQTFENKMTQDIMDEIGEGLDIVSAGGLGKYVPVFGKALGGAITANEAVRTGASTVGKELAKEARNTAAITMGKKLISSNVGSNTPPQSQVGRPAPPIPITPTQPPPTSTPPPTPNIGGLFQAPIP